jgi:hypothetical protein
MCLSEVDALAHSCFVNLSILLGPSQAVFFTRELQIFASEIGMAGQREGNPGVLLSVSLGQEKCHRLQSYQSVCNQKVRGGARQTMRQPRSSVVLQGLACRKRV